MKLAKETLMKKFINRVYNGVQRRLCMLVNRLKGTFLFEILCYWKLIRKYNASVNTDLDKVKMEYTLLRETHVVEKGLSMKNPKLGFGKKKVFDLLNRLDLYIERYGDDSKFITKSMSTIMSYLIYTKETGVDIDLLYNLFNQIKNKHSIEIKNEDGGYLTVNKDEILQQTKVSFFDFLKSRHSIRYFLDQKVDRNTIRTGLEIAQRTPSACNRQGWHTHVYQGDLSIALAKWQGGCNGFDDEIRNSILVTADLKAFLDHEVFQAYIDGGMYAMNLINSLHSLGLGTMPLSCGFRLEKLKQLRNFGIPSNEIPILLIGFGYLPEKVKIAVSSRKNIEETNIFHIAE